MVEWRPRISTPARESAGRGAGPLFTGMMQGEPPAHIRIPTAWLPDATVVNYRIRITVRQAFSADIVRDR